MKFERTPLKDALDRLAQIYGYTWGRRKSGLLQFHVAPDPKTVIVTLKDPLARFLAMGIASGIGPVPKHIWEGKPWLDPQGNPEVRKPSVVSGPYLPDELSAERHSYKRNPNWWGPAPNLDRIEFISASNPTATLELLRTRQVEWAHDFPPSQYGDAKQISTANVLDWTPAVVTLGIGAGCLYLAPRQTKPGDKIGLLGLAGLLVLVGLVFAIPMVIPYISGPFWFFAKVFAIIYMFMWARFTFPRYRYDQLMKLGWKWMIPLGMANLLATAALILLKKQYWGAP